MPSYYHKLNNHLKKEDVADDDLKKEIDQEHNYVGAEYLYLKNKLNSGQIHRNLRENTYKNEYINKYDEIYQIMFSLYWVLFVIYVGLSAYRGEFYVHTFVIIIIMIAFPFFINPLTDIVKIAMNDGLDYMNHFSISDPNIVKKGEDWAEDVQKNFYKSDSGKKIAKAFESGTDSASRYMRKGKMTNSERDLEDLLNSLGTPPNIPTSIEIITQDNKPTLQFIDRFGKILYVQKLSSSNADKTTWKESSTVLTANNDPIKKTPYNIEWIATLNIIRTLPRLQIRSDDDGSNIEIDNGLQIELTLNSEQITSKHIYTWEYQDDEGWVIIDAEGKQPLKSIPVRYNNKITYTWNQKEDDSWVKKIS